MEQKKDYHRYLSTLDVWALSLGCIIGWGAFVMPGMAGRKSACCIIDRIFKRSGVKQVASGQHGRKTRVVKSFHSLRSRFVTMCAEAGIPLEIVKVVVGHTTQKMTEHYAHIREKAVKEAFDRAGVR